MISLALLNKARIIDCHVHDQHNDGDIRVEFPVPFLPEIMCEKNHIVRCTECRNGSYIFSCINCGRKVLFKEDPYFPHNVNLLKSAGGNEIIFPMITISPFINEEIGKYDKLFPGEIIGYKLHPNFSTYYLSKINIESSRILIIHCGIGQYDNANLLLDFAENYKGPVIIAHLGRLSESAFQRAKRLENVFFDCSSIGLIWKSYQNDSYNLCDSCYLGVFSSPDQLLKSVIDYVGVEKIVFGSDEPYGSFQEDINIIERISDDDKNKILYKNFGQLIRGQIKNV